MAAALISAGVSLLPSATALAGGGGCRGLPVSSGSGVTVELRHTCFTPTILRVQPNDTVTFVNREEMDHSVTGAGMSFGSYDAVGFNKSVSYRFSTSGVYPYFCFYHPGMTGAIVVGDGSGPGPTKVDGVTVAAVVTHPAAAATSKPLPAAPPTPWPLIVAAVLVAGAAGFSGGRYRRRGV
jgi:plastocyanin